MLKWFNGCSTIDEVKKQYRKLAFKYHPDITQDITADQNMKEINNEYEKVFKMIENGFTPDQQKQYKKQGHSVDDGYREMINKILHIPNIVIEICGSWIWVGGETKVVKKQLKDAGYWWAGKKEKWYWRPEEYKASKNRKSMSMDHIRNKYGSNIINPDPLTPIAS